MKATPPYAERFTVVQFFFDICLNRYHSSFLLGLGRESISEGVIGKNKGVHRRRARTYV